MASLSQSKAIGRAFAQALVPWFRKNARDLPWRRDKTPYRVWLSEVMLQQTQVAAVVPYYERFLARFPSLESLATAPVEDVLALWSGLGYYRRARLLHAAARAAHGLGGFPDNAAALAELPGFGPYTAAAVASFAFGEDVPLVDGNVARVLARLFGWRGDVDEARKAAWDAAPALITPKMGPAINEALMELGATVCTPRSPSCSPCPLGFVCAARKLGQTEEIPAPRPKKKKPPLDVACVVSERRGAVLLAQRKEGGLFGGLWEPPGTLLEGAHDRANAERLLRSSLRSMGFTLGAIDKKTRVLRELTHRSLSYYVHRAATTGTMRPNAAYVSARWVALDEVASLGMASAAVAALRAGGVAVETKRSAR